MERQIIEIFVLTFTTISLGYIASKIANSKKVSLIGAIGVIFLVSLIATGVVISYNQWINKEEILTEINNPSLEGVWYEIYDTKDKLKKNYGIGHFDLDTVSNNISFHGSAYDENGTTVGTWKSEYSFLDKITFIYMYDGWSKNEEPKEKDRKGFGKIDFHQPTNSEYLQGTGFYNSLKDTTVRWYDIIKITDEELARIAKENPQKYVVEHLINNEN